MDIEIKEKNIEILVIDDDNQVLNLLNDLLGDEGYRVSLAGNSDEALSKIDNGEYDLILLDINLPGASGFDIASTIRQDHKETDLPILFNTGYTDQHDINEAFDHGGFDYITKPIQRKELLARVEHTLIISKYQNRLAQQVRERTEELETKNEELERANVALEELLKRIESRDEETQKRIKQKVEELIRPHFEKLKQRIGSPNEEILKSIEDNYFEIFDREGDKLSELRDTLTTREFEICTYIRRGLTSKEIASVLGRSTSTVNNHRENIRQKLDLKNENIQLAEYLKQIE